MLEKQDENKRKDRLINVLKQWKGLTLFLKDSDHSHHNLKDQEKVSINDTVRQIYELMEHELLIRRKCEIKNEGVFLS
jgi:predicted transcriptional regulator